MCRCRNLRPAFADAPGGSAQGADNLLLLAAGRGRGKQADDEIARRQLGKYPPETGPGAPLDPIAIHGPRQLTLADHEPQTGVPHLIGKRHDQIRF